MAQVDPGEGFQFLVRQGLAVVAEEGTDIARVHLLARRKQSHCLNGVQAREGLEVVAGNGGARNPQEHAGHHP